MPRQTAEKSIIFPDGFQFAIDVGQGFEDIGIIAGGATCTLSYDEFDLDAGNYEDLLSYAKNPTIALAPSAIWNWNPLIIKKLMMGFMNYDGTDLTFAGNSKYFTINRATLRLQHYDGEVTEVLEEADITTLDAGTVNDYITVPKATFPGALEWTTQIDGLVEIEGMAEVHVDDKEEVASQGNFYTDATNLYLIVEAGTYADLALAKAGLAGTVAKAYTSVDWAFTVYNAKVDSGASMQFKGVNEDGLSEYNVSFTGKPDPAQGHRLMTFFKGGA